MHLLTFNNTSIFYSRARLPDPVRIEHELYTRLVTPTIIRLSLLDLKRMTVIHLYFEIITFFLTVTVAPSRAYHRFMVLLHSAMLLS